MKINDTRTLCPTFGEIEPGTVFKILNSCDGDTNDICMKLADGVRWNNDSCGAVTLDIGSPMYIRSDVEVIILNAELTIK